MFPYREDNSHKGDNGRVCVIGGSVDYYGAPIFASLGTVYSGTDLVYMFVPQSNFDCSRSFYPDFIVRKFNGNFLSSDSVDEIVITANKCHTAVIGPGLGSEPETLKALRKLIPKLTIPLILDADALKIITEVKLNHKTLLTPHKGEFEKLTNTEFPSTLNEQIKLIKHAAQSMGVDILVKGKTDIIMRSDGEYRINNTGNAGMTVGGSGDVLAGFTASLVAQGATLFEAACMSSYCFGLCGEFLETQKSYAFSATDLALEIPYVLKKVLG